VRIVSVPRFNFTAEFSYRSVKKLEKDAEAELQVAWIVSLRDCTETRCTKLHAGSKWIEEVGMVEQVEGLGTELAVDTLKDREVT
jgi:hypothetical protein